MNILRELGAYYQNRDVRNRIFEFLGGDGDGNFTCQFFTSDGLNKAHRRPQYMDSLDSCLAQGNDICRSLWDSKSLIAHLDFEYVNFDFPGEAYLQPDRIFGLQAPAITVTKRLLAEYGIRPLHVLSGRGHHFTWRIPQESALFENLVKIGEGSPSSLQIYSEYRTFNGERPPAKLTAAFAGLALVIELLAHQIKEQAAPLSCIPVEITAVEAGPSQCGREIISIDISEYGDPLPSRAIRIPFSGYLKPWQQEETVGHNVAVSVPPIFTIPIEGLPTSQAVCIMRDPKLTAKLAETVSTRIPEMSHGMETLIREYEGSPLRRFHDWFYSQSHNPSGSWPSTYDKTPLEPLPACARAVLLNPNDLLLRPSEIRLVTRVLTALGWHPRHIAGLIRSKFERDFGWGDAWEGYDPAMRADFYTRVFSGLFMTGRDNLVDFNCQSAKEEKICNIQHCQKNLCAFQHSALIRREYDYVAHRPFNRLLLPEVHL